MKESNNNILNLQKIEKAQAKQKQYIEAQKTHEEWIRCKENLAKRQKEEIDKRKNELINEYEIKNQKEIDEYISKVNEMRLNLENERQKELDNLSKKYEKIKGQLKSLQETEQKRIEANPAYKVKDINETHLNTTKSFVKPGMQTETIETKKKILMNKINKANQ